jgi:hypothetical protein
MLLKIAVLLSAACSCAIAIKGEDTVEIDTGNYYDIVDFGFLVRGEPSETVFHVAVFARSCCTRFFGPQKGGTFDVTVKISNSDLNGSPQRIFLFGLYDSGMNYVSPLFVAAFVLFSSRLVVNPVSFPMIPTTCARVM